MKRFSFGSLSLLLLGLLVLSFARGSHGAGYRVSSLGPAISVAGVTAGGAVFATVATGPDTQSAAYLSPSAPSTLVPTGYAWSEAAAVAGPWEFVNAQSTPGKTFGLRRSGGAWSKALPSSGHTAAKILRGDLDGTAYGWSLGKISGAARPRCAHRPGDAARSRAPAPIAERKGDT